MATYNVTRFTRQLLKRYRKEPPSLVLHLYPTHFRFEQQHGNFNYDSPMKCFLEAIREQVLPTTLLDVLDEAGVRYYEGCLIVEVHDHRSAPPPPTLTRPGLALSFQMNTSRDAPTASKAEVYRIVLAQNPATLWTEIGIMDKRSQAERGEEGEGVGLTEEEAVEIEAMILARTVPPLCLSPSLQTTRIANSMLRATTLRPPKRKRERASGDAEDDEDGEEGGRREREEREKLMKIGDEGVGRGRGHAFARLAFIQAYRERSNPNQPMPAPTPVPTPPAPAPAPATSSGITLRLGGPSHYSNASTPGGQAGSPPKRSDTEGLTPQASYGGGGSKKLSKKAQLAATAAAASSLSLDPNDPSLPTDPNEKERVLNERKRVVAGKKRAEAKVRQKEKRAMSVQHQHQAHATDPQVAGSAQGRPGGMGTGSTTGGGRVSWSGAQ